MTVRVEGLWKWELEVLRLRDSETKKGMSRGAEKRARVGEKDVGYCESVSVTDACNDPLLDFDDICPSPEAGGCHDMTDDIYIL